MKLGNNLLKLTLNCMIQGSMAMKIDDKHEANVDSLNLFLINIDFI